MIGSLRQHVSAREHAGALRGWRLRAGLSQSALATTLGVSRRSITRWESGRGRLHRIWLSRIEQLAQNATSAKETTP